MLEPTPNTSPEQPRPLLRLVEPTPTAEDRCADCGEEIYLPADRVCFATVNGDNRSCPHSEFGWHEPRLGADHA